MRKKLLNFFMLFCGFFLFFGTNYQIHAGIKPYISGIYEYSYWLELGEISGVNFSDSYYFIDNIQSVTSNISIEIFSGNKSVSCSGQLPIPYIIIYSDYNGYLRIDEKTGCKINNNDNIDSGDLRIDSTSMNSGINSLRIKTLGKINASCGTASKNYSHDELLFSGSLCKSGTVETIPTFPSLGTSTSWTCKGNGGGINAICNATRDGKIKLGNLNILSLNLNQRYDYNDLTSHVGSTNQTINYKNTQLSEIQGNGKGDPVTLSNGEFTYENTFMSVPGIGKPFEVKLNYKNQLYYNGVVGVNWDHNYNQYLSEEENGNMMYYNGKLGVFRFLKNESTYSYNEGLQATLVKNANDSLSIVYDSGEKINFNTDKKISNIIDKHGNIMKFEYLNGLLAKVTDTLNREYFYEYNANNKLSSVTDFTGNKVLFDYYNGSTGSGSENDLKEVTLLNGDKSKTISYEYTTNGDQTSNHNLTKLIDAKGQTYVENIYQDDRVITQKFGNGDINYEYTLAENGTVAKNKVTDRENHITEYEYDNGKNTRMTIFTASGNLVYDYEYNDLGLISKEKRPKGNGFTFLYDAKGNMIEKRSKTQVDAENSSNDQVVSMTYNDQNKILTQTDALGNLSTFEYDQKGNLIKVQKEVSGETLTVENTYDNYGNISQTKDPQGNITTYTYFAGKLTKVSKLAKDRSGLLGIFEDDANDIITQFEYDDYGNIVEKIDARGNKTSLTYNEFHNLIQTLSAENMLTKTEYDDTNNPIRSIFGSGSQRETLTEYNLLDKPSKTTINIDTDLKNIVEQTYDKNDNLKKVSYQNGSFFTYEYDFSNKVIAKSITDSEGNTTTTQYAYDTNGNIIETTLPNGKKLQYQYDLFDRLIKEIDTLGNYKFYVYDKANRLTATQIWSGENVMLSEVINTYDEAGRVLESKVHDLEKNIFLTTTQSYDVLGQLVKTTNTLGHQTHFAYDEFQRLISQTDALGNKVVSSYDKNGNVVKKTIVQNNGKTTQTLYSYDKDNKLVQEINYLGKSKNYLYDTFGQVEKITDENGNITRFEYNFVGNLTKEIQYLSGSVIELKSSYDAFGNKISATDENGNITRFEYDSLHRLVKEIYPDEKNITYTYDVYGNMISQKDPNGNILTYVYDDNFRVIEKNISRGENIKGTTKETYSYDNLSRLVEVKSFEGETLISTLGFAYNQLNQLISETNNSQTIHYDYDTLGNMVKITYPNGTIVEKSYDELARLKTIAKDTSALVSYTYDGIALVQTQLQNGAKTLTTQDELLRTKTLNHTVGETTLKNYTYTYDDVSNILSTGEKTYQYDSLYRLSQETQNTGVFEYVYDPAGNRTSSTTSSGTLTYQSNILNQYASISLGDKNITYTYDKNGNLIEDENFQYIYDYKNRIVEVIKKATSAQTGTGSNSGSGSNTGSGTTPPNPGDNTGSGSQSGSGQTSPYERLLEAENLSIGSAGLIVQDSGASNNQSVQYTLSQNAGNMVFGPYDAMGLQDGTTYSVTYRLKTSNPSLTQKIALIDIFDDNGSYRNYKEIAGNDFANADEWKDITLEFTKTPEMQHLEYRVFSYGNSDITLDFVKLTQKEQTPTDPEPIPLYSRVMESESLSVGSAGGVIDDVDASAGKAIYASVENNDGGTLQFGPYDTIGLQDGKSYTVTYRVKTNDTTSNQNFMLIDIFDDVTGTRILKEIAPNEFTFSGQYQDFTLEFTKTAEMQHLEYRVFFYDVQDVWIDKVTLQEKQSLVVATAQVAFLGDVSSFFRNVRNNLTQKFESENLGTIIGTTITDTSASNGAYISVDSTQSNGGTLQFGPYASNLEAGKNYRLTFRLKTQNNALNTYIALIDAFDDTTGFRAFKEIKASDFASNDTWQEFSVDFTKATNGNQMEYRVFFYGVANTSLAVDSTEIEEIETQVTPEEFAYESENLGTIVGTTITDPSASNGAYISVDSTQSNGGTLQFGPYASNLEAGKNYKATFRLKTQNNALNTHIALIDAFDDTTGFRAFKEIKASDFASNDTWQEFSVDFTKASTGNQMEYRVFFYGVADSSLAVDSTKVTKISSTTPTPDPDPVTPPTNTPAYSMVTYSYDATGRRFAKVVKDASGAILENISYTYAGEQVIEETSGTTQKAFFYGNAGVDDMVAFTQNNQTYFLHKDHLGSTLAISDISANIITTYDYDAYGNVSLTSGSQAFQNDRLFTGREYEKETGLYYYRARFYSPKTGRFLSRDPIGIQDDVNLYAYVGNNPVMFTDPSGKIKQAIEDAEDALDYIKDGKDKAQYNVGKSLVVVGGAISGFNTPTCVGSVSIATTCFSITGGLSLATGGAATPSMMVCVPSGITAGSSCSAVAAGAGISGLGGYMMASANNSSSSSSGGGGGKKGDSPENPMDTYDALTEMEKFLGEGAIEMGNGRYVSKDGMRQGRIGDSDILGKHAGGPHINLEKYIINSKTGLKELDKTYNKHLYFKD